MLNNQLASFTTSETSIDLKEHPFVELTRKLMMPFCTNESHYLSDMIEKPLATHSSLCSTN